MEPTRATINEPMLLAVYALVPIALALIAVDVLFLERWLQSVLPTDPDTMPVFPYLFVLPHIVSSTVIRKCVFSSSSTYSTTS